MERARVCLKYRRRSWLTLNLGVKLRYYCGKISENHLSRFSSESMCLGSFLAWFVRLMQPGSLSTASSFTRRILTYSTGCNVPEEGFAGDILEVETS